MRIVFAGHRWVRHLVAFASLAVMMSPDSRAQRFLTPPQPGDPKELAERYVKQVRAEWGLTPQDVQGLKLVDSHVSRNGGISHFYFQQTVDGIPVYNAQVNVSVAADGRVLAAGNRAVAGGAARANGRQPGVDVVVAARAAAGHLGLAASPDTRVVKRKDGEARESVLDAGEALKPDIPARLVYVPDGAGRLRLAWSMTLEPARGDGMWDIRIDAENGAVLGKDDLVVRCAFAPPQTLPPRASSFRPPPLAVPADPVPSAAIAPESALGLGSYMVFALPLESPSHGARTLVEDPSHPTASPYGWHDTNGQPGPESLASVGNNVDAYLDLDDDDVPTGGDAARAVGTAGLVFNFPLDLAQGPSTYRPAAVANLFYWNNIMHDVLHSYGFDEASGNFQQNNYGRGGQGGDAVQAEAQDGGGTNNANFATPPDGSPGRMQMYLWDRTNPDRDGDFDNGIIAHEYGHGVSIRLTGGPSNSGCLRNSEQMGEGWSDYFGMLLTLRVGDTGESPRGVGTFALGEPVNGPGIRDYPYSTDLGTDPRTYNGIKTASVPHGVGSIWCAMLWEMTWALIGEYGFDPDMHAGTGGNNIALRLVMEALKLQPCSPGFVDGRDAILAADLALHGGRHHCLIWAAFAKRGLGFSAAQGSSGSVADGAEAFDLPPSCLHVLKTQVLLAPSPLPAGNILSCTLEVRNDSTNALTGVVLTSPLPASTYFQAGSASDGGSLVGNQVTWPGVNMATGTVFTRTFAIEADPGLGPVLGFADDMESGPAAWQASTDSGGALWSLHTLRSSSPTHAWFAANGSSSSRTYLTMAAPILVPARAATLSFQHYYDTEGGWDGGYVEVCVDGGPWMATDSLFLNNGYTDTLGGGPADGRSAFTGESGGFIQSDMDLSSFAGRSLRVRFAFSTDSSVAAEGWHVDDVRVHSANEILVRACALALEGDEACAEAVVPVAHGTRPDFSVRPRVEPALGCLPTNVLITVDVNAHNGFSELVTLSAPTLPPGLTASFSPNPVAAGSSSTLTLANLDSLAPGAHSLVVQGEAGVAVRHHAFPLEVESSALAAPTLVSPAPGVEPVPLNPTLSWTASPGAAGYTLQIATDPGFTNIVHSYSGTATTHIPSTALAPFLVHHWRVTASNRCVIVASAASTFRTLDPPALEVQPGQLAYAIAQNTRQSKALVLSNPSAESGLNWTLQSLPAWLESDLDTGPLAPGASLSLSLTADSRLLVPGLHEGVLRIGTDAADIPVLDVPVELRVSGLSLGLSSPVLSTCKPAAASATLSLLPVEGAEGSVALSLVNPPSGSTVSFSPNPVVVPGPGAQGRAEVVVSIAGSQNIAAGTHNLILRAVLGTATSEVAAVLNVDVGEPAAATPVFPVHHSVSQPSRPRYAWTAAARARAYRLEVATDQGFTNLVEVAETTGLEWNATVQLLGDTAYHWRVVSSNACGSAVSAPLQFRTAAITCLSFPLTSLHLRIPEVGTDGSATSTVAVAATGLVTDVNVRNLAGTHTYMGDLRFVLRNPGGTEVSLVSRICRNADNFSFSLDDEADPGALPCPATDGHTYKPDSPLAAFKGQPAEGLWELRVHDLASLDSGFLESWTLEVCVSAAPTPLQPVLYYNLDEAAGTTVPNLGSLGGTGELRGSDGDERWGGGAPAGASPDGGLSLDGEDRPTGDWIETGFTAGALGLNASNYTAAAWIRLDKASGDAHVFGQIHAASGVLHLGVRNRHAHLGHWANDTTGGRTLSTSSWHHVVWQVREGWQRIFVDGLLDGGPNKRGLLQDSGNVVIGTSGPSGWSFRGEIDEIVLYDQALDLGQIRHLAAGGDPRLLPSGPLQDGDFYTAPYGAGGTWNLYEVVGRDAGLPASWHEAESVARARLDPSGASSVPGHLAQIGSRQENFFVNRISAFDRCWIGLTDDHLVHPGVEAGGNRNGGWVWTSGEAYAFQNWAGNEPNDGTPGEDAVEMGATGLWNDHLSGIPNTPQSNGLARVHVVEWRVQHPVPVPGARVPAALLPPGAPGEPGADGEFSGRVYASTLDLNGLVPALELLSQPEQLLIEERVPEINHRDPEAYGPTGLFPSDLPILANTPAVDLRRLYQFKGTLLVPRTASYTFGVHSDDGFALRIPGASWSSASGLGWVDTFAPDTLFYPYAVADSNTRGTLLLAAGRHDVELFIHQGEGGSFHEFYAAEGSFSSDNDSLDWRLVGGEPQMAAPVPGIVPVNGTNWTVEVSPPGGTALLTLQAAQNELASGVGLHRSGWDEIDFVDPEDPGSRGTMRGDHPFPNGTAGNDDNFAVRASALLSIPAEGDYVFGFRGDDGGSLQIVGQSWNAILMGTGNGAVIAGDTVRVDALTTDSLTRARIHLAAGMYTVVALYWEQGGGAHFEVHGDSALRGLPRLLRAGVAGFEPFDGALAVVGEYVLVVNPLASPGQRKPVLRWNSEPGRRYTVHRGTTLQTLVPLASDLPATPPVNELEDTSAVEDRYYYRIEAVDP